MKFLLVALVILLNIGAHIMYKSVSMSMKSSGLYELLEEIFFNLKTYMGLSMQGFALVLWFVLLRNSGLIWAGLMSSLIAVGIVISGYFIFNEALAMKVVIGAVLVVVGLFIINA
jgi:hypothetical protein